MRIITLIILLGLLSCGERITQKNYAELRGLKETLEKTSSHLRADIQNNLYRIENTLKERGQFNQSELYISANDLVLESTEYYDLIRKWKDNLFIKTGGFSDEYTESFYWYRKIKPENYRPESIHPDWDNVSIKGSKTLIIALIELSNHEINYLTSQLEIIEGMKNELNPELGSEIFLVNEIQLAYQDPRKETMIWNVCYFPIDTLKINGMKYVSDSTFKFGTEEWSQMINSDTEISADFNFLYGDTTIYFRVPR